MRAALVAMVSLSLNCGTACNQEPHREAPSGEGVATAPAPKVPEGNANAPTASSSPQAPANEPAATTLPSGAPAPGDSQERSRAGGSSERPGAQGQVATPDSAASAAVTPGSSGKGPASPGKVIRGPVVNGEAFSVWLETTGGYAAGQPGAVVAVVVPKEPYKCNAEYPYKFQTSGAAGVSYAQPIARGASIDKKRTTLAVPFTADKSGPAEVKGTLSFSVCTEERCLVEKRDLTVAFAITAN